MKIHFKGAAQTVTGSKHLLETDEGYMVLLDCGMYQGRERKHGDANLAFGFDPKTIDCMVLSHAHIDHAGLIPKLVKEGFTGPIYCTEPTRDLCQIMLADSAQIQMHDRHQHKKHNSQEEEEPLYDIDDVIAAMKLFEPLTYGEWHAVSDKLTLMFTHVGHIIGSACVSIRIKEGARTHRIAFTGDIGRKNQRIIKGWEDFPQAEVIIAESTYGDRLHRNTDNAEAKFLEIVKRTCVEKKGNLIIPAFSLGRTQEIVHALDKMETDGLLPPIKVFVDSPMSTNATEVVRSFPSEYNSRVLKYLERDDTPFGFNGLHYVRDAEHSKLINTLNEPCIIISASGMLEAGRILHHVRNNVSDSKNTILIVGYCEPSSIGGQIQSGAKTIRIYGVECEVHADIEVMDEYSAHGDYEEMAEYLSCQNPEEVQQVFLVHGRIEAQEIYRDYLLKNGFRNVEIPNLDDVVELS